MFAVPVQASMIVPHTASDVVLVNSTGGGPAAADASTGLQRPETLADAIAYVTYPENNEAGITTINFAKTIKSIKLTEGIDISGNGVMIDGSALTASPILFAPAGANESDIQNLTLVGGSGTNGADVEVDGSAYISHVTVRSGDAAAAAPIAGTGDVTLNDSSVLTSTGQQAGAVALDGAGSQLWLEGSTLGRDSSSTGAGAIALSGGTQAIIENSTIADDSGTTAALTIGSTGSLTIEDSTIAYNVASDPSAVGGGVEDTGTGAATIESTIIAGNKAATVPDAYFGAVTPSVSYSLIGNATGSRITSDANDTDLLGTRTSPVNPQLSALGSHGGATQTMVPGANSPAVDTGHQAGSTLDQRGFPRTIDWTTKANATGGDGTDIGAVERQATPVGHSRRIGNLRFTLTTPTTKTSTTVNPWLPVKFTVRKLKGHRYPARRFNAAQIGVDRGVAVGLLARGSSTSLKLGLLNLRGKVAGTHTVYAHVSYQLKIGGKWRTRVSTMTAKVKVRSGE
jgi:hypothetical protein